MYLFELLFIFSCAPVIWFWLDSMKAREAARFRAANLCRSHNLQFLDDTVHLQSIKIRKNNHGQFKLCRRYGYEFNNHDERRYTGSITLLGQLVAETHMDAYRMDDYS